MKRAVLVSGIALLALCASLAADANRRDDFTLVGEKSFKTGYAASNADGTVNVVIEIPTGTTAKWEVEEDGVMRWEFKKGKPRVVQYLPYPGNYGMVPRTLLPKELGGDGDPLDVIVLGDAVARGTVAKARVLGVLKMLDDGEQDDKLVAVIDGSPLSMAQDLKALDAKFPGVTSIVETWFDHYKGPGEIETAGYAGTAAAIKVLRAAEQAFKDAQGH